MHAIYLKMLKTVDSICEKNNINYHLEGGTLLGAIRDKGFIPWDDDCDLTFYRDEYEKFKKVAKDELKKNGMELVEAYDNDEFHDFVDRIFYVDKVYREEDIYKNRLRGYYQYIWIDLFILDDIDINKKSNALFMQKLIYGLALGHRKNFTHRVGSKIQFIVAKMISLIGKLFNIKTIYKWHKKISNKYNNKGFKYVYCTNYAPVWLGYINEKEKELDIIKVNFEDTKLPVIKTYDEYLKYWYDDYMKLPEEKDRVPMHKEDIL